MNQLIKEIEARATNRTQYLLAVEASKTGRKSSDITEQEKVSMFNRVFAELIVQECMDVVRDINQEHDGGDTVVNAADEIREHFGVE